MAISLAICTLEEARAAAPASDAVLSLMDPGQSPGFTAPLHRVIEVHDVDSDDAATRAPDAACADAVLAFADEVAALEPPARVLIHCQAGVSRSPAAALGLLLRLFPSWTPTRAAEQVDVSTFGHASPNRALTAALDAALGLDGRLRAAVSERFLD